MQTNTEVNLLQVNQRLNWCYNQTESVDPTKRSQTVVTSCHKLGGGGYPTLMALFISLYFLYFITAPIYLDQN